MVLRPSNSRKRHNIQRREKAATKETKKKKNNKKLSDIQKAICIVDISAFEEWDANSLFQVWPLKAGLKNWWTANSRGTFLFCDP